jgi:hypothetical protein
LAASREDIAALLIETREIETRELGKSEILRREARSMPWHKGCLQRARYAAKTLTDSALLG